MNLFTDLWEKTKIQFKCAFFSTICFSIISQGMGLFNKFSVSDDLNYGFNGGNPLPYGRWMLYILRRAERIFYGDGNYSLPVINGLISIICIGISLCLLIDLLKIHNTFLCILLGGIMVSAPGITGLFGHMYTAQFYSYALLLSVLGPWMILKKEKWIFYAAGIGSMVCATAIYQAYIPVILCTFLFGMIKQFSEINDRKQLIAGLKKIGIILCCCLMFIGIYFFATSVINRHFGIILTNYKNVNEMGKVSFPVYIHRMLIAYREFFLPSRTTYYDMFPGNIRFLYYGLILISVLLSGKLLYANRKNMITCMILMLSILLVPLAVNFIFVMVEREFCSILMVYAKVVFFVFFAWLLEITVKNKDSLVNRFTGIISYSCLSLLILMFCRFDNECYLRMALVQTQATRYYSTLVTRIQSTEGYDSWKYVSFVGTPQPGKDNSIDNIAELEHILIHPYFGLTNTLKGNWKEYLRVWCGYTAHETGASYFEDNPEVQAMPHYPAEGSIKVIDDTVVVKF